MSQNLSLSRRPRMGGSCTPAAAADRLDSVGVGLDALTHLCAVFAQRGENRGESRGSLAAGRLLNFLHTCAVRRPWQA